MHFSWSKILVLNGNAPQQLCDYYSGDHGLAPEQREKEEKTKTECISEWQSDLVLGGQSLHLSVEAV